MKRHSILMSSSLLAWGSALVLTMWLTGCGVMEYWIGSRPVTLVGGGNQLRIKEDAPSIARTKIIRGHGAEFDISPMNEVLESSYDFILFIPIDKFGRKGTWEHKKPFMVDVMYKLDSDTRWEIVDPSLTLDHAVYQPILYDAGHQVCYNVKPLPQQQQPIPYSLRAQNTGSSPGKQENWRCVLFAFPVETPEPERPFTINFGYLEIKGKRIPFIVRFGPVHYTSGGFS